MPSGMNQFNQMEHMQAEARKQQAAMQNQAQQATQAQTAPPPADPNAQSGGAPLAQPAPAAVPPMGQPGMPMQPAQPQAGRDELIDAVQDGTGTDMNGRPFVNTMADAKKAFAQLLAGGGEEAAPASTIPEGTASMQKNPNVVQGQPETVAPGEGLAANVVDETLTRPQDPNAPATGTQPATGNQRSIESIVQDAVAEMLNRGNAGAGQPQSGTESKETAQSNTTEEPPITIPDINSNEFYEKFTENPGEAISDIANALADQKVRELTAQLQPVIDQSNQMREEQRTTDAIRRFAEQGYDDFNDYRDDMINFMRERQLPTDDPSSYENAYNFAKVRRLQQQNEALSQNQGKTLDDYLQEDDARSRIAADDQIKRMVIEEYLNSLKNGQSPQVITGGSGIAPAASSQNRINSIKEAGQLFKNSMNQ